MLGDSSPHGGKEGGREGNETQESGSSLHIEAGSMAHVGEMHVYEDDDSRS